MERQDMDFQNDLLTELQYAELTGRNVRSVQRERSQRIGPAFIRIGRKIYYRKAAIEEWLIAQEQSQPRTRRAV
ncbi:DNA-binding protein [Roseinatronobacter bogoriensis subsp. barguzinensis]|uniref:DNA-binding protein n=2 Tax=Roseinatronobacter bogoriensis TaxID=119542 RepID=A0A2K8KGQ1_9RHOB|nr:helix-turn-helix domain-containing protein [Rhodobaca barguzinensis]ATX66945.1 DNA-binding protein [Rhodobaca barguzinensis]